MLLVTHLTLGIKANCGIGTGVCKFKYGEGETLLGVSKPLELFSAGLRILAFF